MNFFNGRSAPTLVRAVFLLLILVQSSCSKKSENAVQSGASGAKNVKGEAGLSEGAKRLISHIDANSTKITQSELTPPTEHNGFWVSGNTGPLGIWDNSSGIKGVVFTTWQIAHDPVRGAIAAEKGWVFLRSKGDATVKFNMYIYKLGRQSMADAFAVKYPNSYKKESHDFNCRWEIKGSKLRVTVKGGTNPDPKFFDLEGQAVEFDVADWMTAEDRQRFEEQQRKDAEAASLKAKSEIEEEADRLNKLRGDEAARSEIHAFNSKILFFWIHEIMYVKDPLGTYSRRLDDAIAASAAKAVKEKLIALEGIDYKNEISLYRYLHVLRYNARSDTRINRTTLDNLSRESFIKEFNGIESNRAALNNLNNSESREFQLRFPNGCAWTVSFRRFDSSFEATRGRMDGFDFAPVLLKATVSLPARR